MTKTEFKKMENICKKAWLKLAKTGATTKEDLGLEKYENRCPACHISKKASSRSFHDCLFCPITIWRRQADIDSDAICQENNNAYEIWVISNSEKTRKIYARRIANYKWSWLPEYAKIKL
jgi:hypothetical protein